MKRLLRFFFLLVVLLLIAAFSQRAALKEMWIDWQKPDVEAVAYEEVTEETNETVGIPARTTEVVQSGGEDKVEIFEQQETDAATSDPDSQLPITTYQLPTFPSEYNLAIPFTPQAPHGNWELPYKEACEEASALMVAFYYQSVSGGQIDVDTVDEEILRIVAFEETFFGYNADTTAAETALLIENYYHLTTELLMNPTEVQLKEILAQGYPIIMPAAGQQLGNPYFTPPGPLYHMLVIKGYTEDGFITNDPGTRRGEDYFYETDILLEAIHDWNGGEVDLGERIVIVVKPS